MAGKGRWQIQGAAATTSKNGKARSLQEL